MDRNTKLARRDERQALRQIDERRFITALVDVFENQDEYLMIADVPGVAGDGLDVRVENNELTIEGRIDAQDGGQLSYRRLFSLPGGVDADKVSAELTHGVLRLHLPKAGYLRPRRIPVSAA